MSRKFHIDAERMSRFDFEPVKDLRVRLKTDQDLKRRINEDLPGTLEDEGIVIDDALRQKISDKWHAQIKADTHAVMDRIPDSRKPYYRMIRSGQPVKVRVTINSESGEIITKPREGMS